MSCEGQGDMDRGVCPGGVPAATEQYISPCWSRLYMMMVDPGLEDGWMIHKQAGGEETYYGIAAGCRDTNTPINDPPLLPHTRCP